MLSRLEQHLKQLVEQKTVTGDVKAAATLLHKVGRLLDAEGMEVAHHISNGFPSLIALSQPDITPKLWLIGHIDVVDGSEELFRLQITPDRLIGRGTLDDKSAAASFIEVVQQLGLGIKDYEVGIILTSDEEIGGQNGIGHLASVLDMKNSVAFVPDSGTGWTIELQAKGVAQFQIEVTGKSAHGSKPWEGKSAFQQLLNYLNALRLELEIADPKLARKDFLTTLNVGYVQAGNAANQVPGYATAKIDIRFPEPSQAKEIHVLVEAVARRQDSEIIVTEIVSAPPVKITPENKWVVQFARILQKHGIKPIYSKATGATDARYLVEQGVTVLVSQPAGGKLHAEGEWIDRASLAKMPAIIIDLIRATNAK